MLFTPLMASDKSRVASGGAGNEDPEENAYDYDPGWRDEQHFLRPSLLHVLAYAREYLYKLCLWENGFSPRPKGAKAGL
jgi:FMN phosphatase YigB (HAD superfamily)